MDYASNFRQWTVAGGTLSTSSGHDQYQDGFARGNQSQKIQIVVLTEYTELF